MAIFGSQEKSTETMDWVILRDGGIALYRRREYLHEDLKWFRERNYQIFAFNCENWTPNGMHADFQRTLQFPSYYGDNLDALHDCLEEDLSVPERGGAVIVLNRFDSFSKGRGASLLPPGRTEAEIVLDILARASRYFLLTGRRFLTLVQSDDPHAQFDRLGDVAAIWNWRERLYEDRGL